jgi:hypothetical protein
MLNFQRFAACLLIAIAPISLARGPLNKCLDREGRATLRDEPCRHGERVVTSVHPGEVTRKFTIVAPAPPVPQPAAQPAPQRAPKPAFQPAVGAIPPATP